MRCFLSRYPLYLEYEKFKVFQYNFQDKFKIVFLFKFYTLQPDTERNPSFAKAFFRINQPFKQSYLYRNEVRRFYEWMFDFFVLSVFQSTASTSLKYVHYLMIRLRHCQLIVILHDILVIYRTSTNPSIFYIIISNIPLSNNSF